MAFHPSDNCSFGEHERVDAYPPLPPRRRDNRHGYRDSYAYSSDVQVSSAYANAMIPNGPPPPYQYNAHDAYYSKVYDEERTTSSQQHVRPARKMFQPQHYLPSTHSVDISRKVRASSYKKEEERGRSASLLGRPIPSVFVDCPVVRSMNQSAALCDRVAVRVNDVLSRLDSEDFSYHDIADRVKDATLGESKNEDQQTRGIVDFRKTWQYANSRLPPGLMPMKLYIPTWQIICMAAEASSNAYRRPRKGEKEEFIEANWRQGTKTMIVNSRRTDEQNLMVIAIRGSKFNIIDWAVNFRPAPSEPIGFLDDAGNACHAGFLQVARAMVAPIAARLRHLLEQDTSREPRSLLLTGHSAGGAVASLLYMHMISVTMESELNILTGCFKRIHCVTFGAPPVTFLPLQHPARSKNLFLAFANEGDPIVRANKQYVSTIAKIVAAPSPIASSNSNGSHERQGLRQRISRATLNSASSSGGIYIPVRWEVPPATLSNAGRVVLMRTKPENSRAVEAVQVTDEELRDVIFGDPGMHPMDLYRSRIEQLATAAVTGRPVG